MDATTKTIPDPSTLTTEQLLREVDRVKELMVSELHGLEGRYDTQFGLIERQRVEQKTDTAVAVQAAFSAAKEAVKEQTIASDKAIDKSERAMTDQQKQMASTFTTAIEGVSEVLNDLKERVGRIETATVAVREDANFRLNERHTGAGVNANYVAAIAILVTIAIAVFTVAIATHGFTK
jgi:beta-phosphoglucomutase-like phosphatase (HAD superfamily)